MKIRLNSLAGTVFPWHG